MSPTQPAPSERVASRQALESWDWVDDIADKVPVLSTLFGDNFVVSTNIAGQIHNQFKDLPEGAQITGFNISD